MASYATRLSAGLDLIAQEEVTIKAHSYGSVNVGKVELPTEVKGWIVTGLILPKSGLSKNHNIVCRTGVGDADFKNDYYCTLDNFGDEDYTFKVGDNVAQMVVLPCYQLPQYEVKDKDREGGFGSTGKTE